MFYLAINIRKDIILHYCTSTTTNRYSIAAFIYIRINMLLVLWQHDLYTKHEGYEKIQKKFYVIKYNAI